MKTKSKLDSQLKDSDLRLSTCRSSIDINLKQPMEAILSLSFSLVLYVVKRMKCATDRTHKGLTRLSSTYAVEASIAIQCKVA